MFVRPAGGRQTRAAALRRLQSLSHTTLPRTAPSLQAVSATHIRLIASSSGTPVAPGTPGASGTPAHPNPRPWRSQRALSTTPGDYTHSPSSGLDSTMAVAGSSPLRLYEPTKPPALPLWELRPHNFIEPLVIKDPHHVSAGNNGYRSDARGVPGDSEEMLSVIHACLAVGNIERAALVLQRLSTPEFASPDISIAELQVKFLDSTVERLLLSPSAVKMDKIHKWFEMDVYGSGKAEVSRECIALMLKATLLTTPARSVRRRRFVKRYMSMAPGEAGFEVLYQADILTAEDRAAIAKLCPEYDVAVADAESPTSEAADGTETTPETTPEVKTTPGADAMSADEILNALRESASLQSPAEVMAVPQKGMGLASLKHTLSMFRDVPEGRDIADLPYEQRLEIQRRLERDTIDAALARWSADQRDLDAKGVPTNLSHATLNSRLQEWQSALEIRIKQEFKQIDLAEVSDGRTRTDTDRLLYGPFLRLSTPTRLAAVTILGVLSSLGMSAAEKGLPIGNIITQIARYVEEDIRLAQRLAKTNIKAGNKKATEKIRKFHRNSAIRASFLRKLPRPGDEAETEAVRVQQYVEATKQAATELETELAAARAGGRLPSQYDTPSAAQAQASEQWPITIKAKVGAVLVSMLMETARVDVVKEHPDDGTLVSQSQHAFVRINQLKRGKKVGVLSVNATVLDMLKKEPRADFLARHLPMVVEPRPWSSFSEGGYLELESPIIRMKDNRRDQKTYADVAMARGDMDQVLRGLDVLGRTPWKVNRKVFNVMLEAWNSGEAIGSIPPLHPNIPTPAEPAASDDPNKRRDWLKQVKAAENLRCGVHSQRCFINFQMEIARAFRDQTFYFPHNVDFRGRAYPIPPYFNHMGADHVRGLLTFAKGKPLGAEGLRWLQVHLANVFGFDKASLTERANFAVDNAAHIRDSVADPLGGARWWLQAEDPWQCLATCFELVAAWDLPDPTTYVSSLPVHQDGTCNGLQHYAALGGDSWGAKQVNLEPGDRPADVYSAVAEIVETSMAEDAAKGNTLAGALRGLIKRKVVKQTVMTNVYGVTFNGARKQVLKQLDALYPDLETKTGVSMMMIASYIATKVFQALGTMFSGAHDIQSWLGEIGGRVCRTLKQDQIDLFLRAEPEVSRKAAARLASKAGKQSLAQSRKAQEKDLLAQLRTTIVWTTPLRMPVVQPYRKTVGRYIDTVLQELVLSTPKMSDPVNMRKQLQAFPPNFIHSLDASHMLLSALECDALGLTFAAVHDSFWTHASDIGTMNRVLRDAFIRIHSEDVVGRLAAEFQQRYVDSLYLGKVSRSSPVAKKILAFRKARRGLNLHEELRLEQERVRLLNSRVPELVAQGERMVTPGSIFAKATAGNPAAAEAAMEQEDLDLGFGRTFDEGDKDGSDLDVFAAAEAEAETDADADMLADSDAGLEAELADAEADGDVEAEGSHDAAETDAAADAAADDEMLNGMPLAGTRHFEAQLRNIKAKKKTYPAPVKVWLPLTFPPIPAKGDFDVRRLKDSQYFFS